MCLITKKKTPKITKKDIPVWKSLKSDGVSAPYFDFTYEKGKVYKTKFTYLSNDCEQLSQIKNSYSAFNYNCSYYLDENYDGWREKNHPVRKKLICVSEGFHAFTKKKDTLEHSRDNNGKVVIKFIIPKGSEYIKDENGLIVSNQIKML